MIAIPLLKNKPRWPEERRLCAVRSYSADNLIEEKLSIIALWKIKKDLPSKPLCALSKNAVNLRRTRTKKSGRSGRKLGTRGKYRETKILSTSPDLLIIQTIICGE